VQILDHARQENSFVRPIVETKQSLEEKSKLFPEKNTIFDASAEKEEKGGVEGDAPQGGRPQHSAAERCRRPSDVQVITCKKVHQLSTALVTPLGSQVTRLAHKNKSVCGATSSPLQLSSLE